MLFTLILLQLMFHNVVLTAQACPAPPIIVNGTWANNYTIYTNGTPSQNLITSFRCQNIPLDTIYFFIIYLSIIAILTASERSLIRFTYASFIGMFIAFAFEATGILSAYVTGITIIIWGLSVLLIWFRGS